MDPIVTEKRFEETPGPNRTRTIALAAATVVLVGAVAGGGLAWYRSHHPEEPAAGPPAAPVAPAAEPQAPSHPLPAAGEPELPATPEGADAALLAELARLTETPDLSRWIRPTGLVRHVVATIDALPRRQVPLSVLPTTSVPGAFMVRNVPEGQVISEDNAKRYLPWVHLLLSVDPASAASAYRRLYPLFQRAYRELGYPSGYFNDRLVEAIDDLLETPTPAAAPRVVQPSVMWRFEDPELESLSAGQRTLLRMGPASGSGVRQWLQAFRARIA